MYKNKNRSFDLTFQKYWSICVCNELIHAHLARLLLLKFVSFIENIKILIKIHQILIFLVFCWNFILALRKSNHYNYVFQKLYESMCQKYWLFFICNYLFNIFGMHGWEEIHCRGFFLLFQISSDFDWNLYKNLKFLVFLLKFHTPT